MSFITKIKDRILNLPILKEILDWSKTHSLPGFFDVPLYDVVIFIIQEIKRDNMVTRANSIAYSFVLSIFPTLLVFFTLIPFILPFFQDYIIPFIADDLVIRNLSGEIDFNQTIIAQFNDFLREIRVIPAGVHEQLITFIQEILLEPRFGLLSLGFILAIFFSSNGVLNMMVGFDKMNKTTFRKRNVVMKRLIAIQLTFILGFLVLAAVFFIIFGNTFINWIFSSVNAGSFANISAQILRFITVIFLFYFGISFLYRQGMPTRKKQKYLSAGATLATFLSLITSWGFALYVNNYSSYNDLYGSIGTFIVIMIWIQINAFILLIGFELNASIAVNRDLIIDRRAAAKPKKKKKQIKSPTNTKPDISKPSSTPKPKPKPKKDN